MTETKDEKDPIVSETSTSFGENRKEDKFVISPKYDPPVVPEPDFTGSIISEKPNIPPQESDIDSGKALVKAKKSVKKYGDGMSGIK